MIDETLHRGPQGHGRTEGGSDASGVRTGLGGVRRGSASHGPKRPYAVASIASSGGPLLIVTSSDYLWFADQALNEMVAIIRQLGDDRVNRRPGPEGANSPYVILTH